ncbi:uncharacterized protein LOC132722776 isoform X3 [Ruditapes philippinarum]|nr:uncharacterized protein LOC132722776 isoform X3 [Ruditapes philippinarum]XP_060563322.1 uncharacterized protein LOC132722776 isoform X3 [Ruditapes philippinarum]
MPNIASDTVLFEKLTNTTITEGAIDKALLQNHINTAQVVEAIDTTQVEEATALTKVTKDTASPEEASDKALQCYSQGTALPGEVINIAVHTDTFLPEQARNTAEKVLGSCSNEVQEHCEYTVIIEEQHKLSPRIEEVRPLPDENPETPDTVMPNSASDTVLFEKLTNTTITEEVTDKATSDEALGIALLQNLIDTAQVVEAIDTAQVEEATALTKVTKDTASPKEASEKALQCYSPGTALPGEVINKAVHTDTVLPEQARNTAEKVIGSCSNEVQENCEYTVIIEEQHKPSPRIEEVRPLPDEDPETPDTVMPNSASDTVLFEKLTNTTITEEVTDKATSEEAVDIALLQILIDTAQALEAIDTTQVEEATALTKVTKDTASPKEASEKALQCYSPGTALPGEVTDKAVHTNTVLPEKARNTAEKVIGSCSNEAHENYEYIVIIEEQHKLSPRIEEVRPLPDEDPETPDTVMPNSASDTVLFEKLTNTTITEEVTDKATSEVALGIALLQNLIDTAQVVEAIDTTQVEEAIDTTKVEEATALTKVTKDTASPKEASEKALQCYSPGTALPGEVINKAVHTDTDLPEQARNTAEKVLGSCSNEVQENCEYTVLIEEQHKHSTNNLEMKKNDEGNKFANVSVLKRNRGERKKEQVKKRPKLISESENSDNSPYEVDSDWSPAPVRKRIRQVLESDDNENSDQSEVFPMLSAKRIKLNNVDSEFSDNDENEEEENVFRDINYKNVYISAVKKNHLTKTGKCKVTNRVYDMTHPCPFCSRVTKNFSHHIFSKQHEKEEAVQDIKKIHNEKERKKKIAKLRLKAAHEHNVKVLKEKKGEIYVLRRSNKTEEDSDEDPSYEGTGKTVDISQYGPCPNCYGWIVCRSLKRHMNVCSSENYSSKRSLMVFDIIMGKLPEEASQALVNEVFPIMKNDDIAEIACHDSLIINLGNQWMMRNRGNEIMRKYYTSSVMRLAAKLKQATQKLSNTTLEMSKYLAPKYFEVVTKAALVCCHAEDEEDLKAPSNALKLGHDIKRMVDAKLAKAIIQEDNDEQKEAQDFLRLMSMQWGLRVTKLARYVLIERSFNQVKELPLPDDVKKLSVHLQKELSSIDLEDCTFCNFRKLAVLTLTRITLFNRRRCHEVQALRLSAYAARKIGKNEVGEEIRGELTQFERRLLHSQEHVVIRGKTGRGVPVILPSDVKGALDFLTNQDVRKKAGILKDNPYVFANNGAGVFRAYDSIKEVASSSAAGLIKPNLLRTSNMRKYMATMLQALNTTEAERQWVIDHLGHTMNVHRVHYRQTSDVIERVDVAKILLIQDMGLVSKYRGKKLEDIQLNDVLQDVESEEGVNGADDESSLELDSGLSKELERGSLMFNNNVSEEYIPDIMDEDEEEEDDDYEEINKPSKRKPKKPCNRQKWSLMEENELKELFKEEFKCLKLPGQKRIEKMMKVSLSKNGEIHKRKRDTIKKKLSNMMIKLRNK